MSAGSGGWRRQHSEVTYEQLVELAERHHMPISACGCGCGEAWITPTDHITYYTEET